MTKARWTAPGLALAVCVGGGALAQEADIEALARDYVMLPANHAMMDQMLGADTLAAQFAASLPPQVDLRPETMAEVGVLMEETMAPLRPRMEELMVEGAAETFSEAELRALINFYSTPEGEGVLMKMQPYFTRTMGELTPEIMAAMSTRQDDLMAIMEEDLQ
ncbi:DUF2059 domain-containing protein [Jannaschia sp. S6380]|uniref:DUF2059 domain-containing protein n=1 Tax=Jannaschia sp. S6380 TaxID=2926408 RepID=UPI001FF6F064|nr:DUF2059 domain-containing protein [Jannaschia sp. S6380]MCK0166568.1 DUF2059 domain-containing protein [Jannaschia sp. S6380]